MQPEQQKHSEPEQPQKIALIVDANALIKQINLREVVNRTLKTEDEFKAMYEVYTLQEVINEIRDDRARQFIANLPYEIDVKNGSTFIPEKDQIRVDNFSKDTGDYIGLSQVDRMVIAMGVAISKEKGEYEKIRKNPPSLEEFRPKKFKEFYDEADSDDDFWNEEEKPQQAEKKPESDGFDDFQVTAGGRKGLKGKDIEKYKQKNEELKEKLEHSEKMASQQKPEVPVEPTEDKKEEDSDSDRIDNEEEGGEWVTEENLYKHISGGATNSLLENEDNLLFINKKAGEGSEQPTAEGSEQTTEPTDA